MSSNVTPFTPAPMSSKLATPKGFCGADELIHHLPTNLFHEPPLIYPSGFYPHHRPGLAACGGGLCGDKTSSRPSQSRKDEFISVRDGRFMLRGKPYAYVGANMWFGCYLADAALPGGRARLRRELDRLQNIGAKNVRLLAGSETSPLVAAISRGITKSPREYDEELLRGLDFCLAEMAQRDMRAVLFLSNYWQWSGSFAQHVRWTTGKTFPTPDLPKIAAGDCGSFMKMSARCFTPHRRRMNFISPMLPHLLTRRNTINGRRYHEDPTIMTWELANEPRPGVDSEETMKDVPRFCEWWTPRALHPRPRPATTRLHRLGRHPRLDQEAGSVHRRA